MQFQAVQPRRGPVEVEGQEVPTGFRAACHGAGLPTAEVFTQGYSGPAVRCQKRRELFDVGRAYPGRLTFAEQADGTFLVYPG